jgi:NADPH-ferrihemoprotein reductase
MNLCYLERDFFEWLTHDDRLADVDTLQNLHYVMFGLGNKTYEHFNLMARACDKRLQQLGCKRIGERGEGDDDGNLEEDYLKWKEGMWLSVCAFFGIDPNNVKHELVRSYALKELPSSFQGKVYTGEIGAVQAWNGKQK